MAKQRKCKGQECIMKDCRSKKIQGKKIDRENSTEFRLMHFLEEYFTNGFNATRAYLAVFPSASPESARRSASRLMTNDDIRGRVAERLAERGISEDYLMDKIAQSIKADTRKCYEITDNGQIKIKRPPDDEKPEISDLKMRVIEYDDTGKIARAVESSIRFQDVNKSREVAVKVLGMIKKKVEIEFSKESIIDELEQGKITIEEVNELEKKIENELARRRINDPENVFAETQSEIDRSKKASTKKRNE